MNTDVCLQELAGLRVVFISPVDPTHILHLTIKIIVMANKVVLQDLQLQRQVFPFLNITVSFLGE